MTEAMSASADKAILKFVAFDQVDLDWAVQVAERWHELPLYLSAGTPMPAGRRRARRRRRAIPMALRDRRRKSLNSRTRAYCHNCT